MPRSMILPLVMMLTGCGLLDSGLGDRVEELQADNAALVERVQELEGRLEALEAFHPTEDADETVADAPPDTTASPKPRPTPRPKPAPVADPEPAAPLANPDPSGADPSLPRGTLQVAAPAKGRAVTVEGVETGHVTPAQFLWPAGRVVVRVEGYPDEKVWVEEGETTIVAVR